MAATAPVIAVTYSAPEFVTWEVESPWQFTLRAVVAAGGIPLAIDCSTPQPEIETLVSLCDGLLVLGGGDLDPDTYGGDSSDSTIGGVNPVRDVAELAALDTANTLSLPVLAICRGFQLLNVSRGGSLVVDIPRDRPSSVPHQPGMKALMNHAHDVVVARESVLSRWMQISGPVKVNSEHHQGVGDAGAGLVVTGVAPDGLIEAVESTDGRIVGVQWHPEMLWPNDQSALDLISGFISDCQTDRDVRRSPTARE